MNIEIGATDIYHNVVIETYYYVTRDTWLCKYAYELMPGVYRCDHIIVVIKKSRYILKAFQLYQI